MTTQFVLVIRHAKRALILCLLAAVSLLWTGRDAAAQTAAPPDEGAFAQARAFLLAAYSGLAQRSDLLIWFETNKAKLSQADNDALTARLAVLIAPEAILRHEHDPREPPIPPLFGAMMDLRNRTIWQVHVGQSDLTNTVRNDALRKESDQHPDWTEAQFQEWLDRSVRFPPSNREAATAHIQSMLRRLEPLIGHVRVSDVEFDGRDKFSLAQGHAFTKLSWAARGSITSGNAVDDVVFSFEPYGGELVYFMRTRHVESR